MEADHCRICIEICRSVRLIATTRPRSVRTRRNTERGENVAGIGIIGAGVSGLHLGLYLQAHDVPVTIYTDKDGDTIAAGRLLNTVAHHHHTLERERALGIHHWDVAEHGYVCHHHFISGPGLTFQGDFDHPSMCIDYRMYLPRLMADFQERGGEIRIVPPPEAADVERISGDHDLVVVAVGRGSIGGMFRRRPEKSPYDRPQRRLCAGLYHGVARSEPVGVSFCISPGHGELLELPLLTREGPATAFLFENIPGGETERLVDMPVEEDVPAFERAVLDVITEHYGWVAERIDPSEFRLMGPRDVLQGALTPVVREDYVQLSNGRFALAMGDTHAVVDPIIGQGANSASYSAWKVGERIVDDLAYDERFCQGVAAARAERVMGISDWTNIMLNPPEHVLGLLMAMAENRQLCDAFSSNWDRPERNLEALATPERTRAFMERHTAGSPALAG
jgi:2-polyprenyl-6-methoxyphenol hydroxylase-like FAD-dependent oxidoreductase